MSEEPPIEDCTHLEDVPDGAGCVEIWEHLSDEPEDTDADEDE